MAKTAVCYVSDHHQIIKTNKGSYRIQVKKKRTLKDILLFRQRWMTLIADIENINRAKAIVVIKEYKDVKRRMKEINKSFH